RSEQAQTRDRDTRRNDRCADACPRGRRRELVGRDSRGGARHLWKGAVRSSKRRSAQLKVTLGRTEVPTSPVDVPPSGAHRTSAIGPSLQMWPHTYLVAIGAIADMPDALTHTRKARMTHLCHWAHRFSAAHKVLAANDPSSFMIASTARLIPRSVPSKRYFNEREIIGLRNLR